MRIAGEVCELRPDYNALMAQINVLFRNASVLQGKCLYREAAECYEQIAKILSLNLKVCGYHEAYCAFLDKIEEASVYYSEILTNIEKNSPLFADITSFIKSTSTINNFTSPVVDELRRLYFYRISYPILSDSEEFKEIVAVWDFRSQPYSIGDLVVLNQVANVLACRHKAESIKIILLADASFPARPSFLELGITSDNYLDHIARLLPVAMMGEKVFSIRLENAEAVANEFYDNADVLVWPTKPLLQSRLDLNMLSFNMLNLLYEKDETLPVFTIRKSLSVWALNFIDKTYNGLIPIAVQIRKTQDYNVSRNSNIEAWLEFFEYCENNAPAIFYIVCSANEVDDRLRNRSNVVIVKDHYTSVDQDLALISECRAFIGASSGPSTITFFRDRPYSIINAHIKEIKHLLNKEEWGYSFAFSYKNQRLIESGIETKELLIHELKVLLDAIHDHVDNKLKCSSMLKAKSHGSKLNLH